MISDPELSDGGGRSGAHGGGGDDEVISDPELSGGGGARPAKQDYGWGEVYKPKSGEAQASRESKAAEEPDPTANTGIAKLEASGQTAIDTHAEENLEDFYEARLRFGGEVDFRLSRRLRLSIGTRIDFAWYAPHQHDNSLTREEFVYAPDGQQQFLPDGQPVIRTIRHGALDEDRYEVDIIPLSAYLDATITDGVHLRVGEQVISLGRMDGISVTDMLAVYDFRPQSKVDPAGVKLAQPAIRLDWDFNAWSTLQLVYVPWFMPHLMRGNRDNYVGGALAGGKVAQDPTVISELIDPSWQPIATQDVYRFVGPAPDFRNPQAEARLNFRGNAFELAVLGGTALEKIPALYYTPIINEILLGPGTTDGRSDESALTDAFLMLNAGYPLVDAEYHRYYQVGVDGSFDISPIQVSFELAYSPSRHPYTYDTTGRSLPLPNVSKEILDPNDPRLADPAQQNNYARSVTDRSVRKGVQMVEAALHLEYVRGESLLLAAEAYVFQLLELPHNKDRYWLGFPEGKGTYIGGFLAASYSVKEGLAHFDMSMIATTGPSFMLTPQVEVRVVEGFYLNLGAQFFEGPTPNNINKVRRSATNLTPGGLLSGYDNVYLGFRWVR